MVVQVYNSVVLVPRPTGSSGYDQDFFGGLLSVPNYGAPNKNKDHLGSLIMLMSIEKEKLAKINNNDIIDKVAAQSTLKKKSGQVSNALLYSNQYITIIVNGCTKFKSNNLLIQKCLTTKLFANIHVFDEFLSVFELQIPLKKMLNHYIQMTYQKLCIKFSIINKTLLAMNQNQLFILTAA
ncbi:hypothetical protein AGLY_014497 [Aphis glycines]|uniref:Uncharacterized protein n=1 Tax=Aphis glycines TaxID=307491 RepID=A0A6G0T369_APHGL|nr:hypothetical protein AGLY_014497 [Aphis glycines]